MRDITKADRIVLPASPNADLGWRQAFPITYDISIGPPTDQVDTSQGDGVAQDDLLDHPAAN